jgi:hypothetical protein
MKFERAKKASGEFVPFFTKKTPAYQDVPAFFKA